MSSKEIKEWYDSGFLVNSPDSYDLKEKKQDCFEHASDGIAQNIPGWRVNKTQYKLSSNNGKMNLKKQLEMLNLADKKAGVSRLSLNVANDNQILKEQLGKVISVLALDQDEDFIKNFSINLNGFSSTGSSHMHTFDLSALKNGKQNYDPRFSFKNLKKMEDVFAKYEKVTLDIRTKLDLKTDETLKMLTKILEVLPLDTNGVLAKDNFKTT